MDKKEARAKVEELLSTGTAKRDVFAQLSGQGVNDNQLAYLIASYPDPARCAEHAKKVKWLVAIMIVQALILLPAGFLIGATIGPVAAGLIGTLCMLIPLLFAYGFYTNRVGAYNAYILLSIVQLPNAFKGFMSAPVASAIGLLIAIGIVVLVWHVRDKIFPDFTFVTPRKVNKEYVFEG
jgi:hypothetical protein